MKGFYIKELRVTGTGLEDAVITLSKGLNVINGPSNTGKSYIFNCIDYMFGADSLKNIDESEGYEKLFLEIRDFESDKPITLLRYTNQKDIYYALSDINNFDLSQKSQLKTDHDPNRNDNISKFLLKQIGITENKFMLKNKSGVKKTLGFRAITNLSMISETKIISETDSPVFNKIKTDETYCKSIFKYLLTTVDDINCEEIEKAEIRKAKLDSKIEYITNEISDLLIEQEEIQENLRNYESLEIIDIDDYKEEIIKIEKLIQERRQLINDKREQLNKLNFEKNQLSLLVNKFQILHKQYESDLQRLIFLQDGKDFLDQIHLNNCPICDSRLDTDALNEEYSLEVIEAAQQEEIKINSHLSELDKSINTTQSEIATIDLTKQSYEREIISYNKEVEEIVERNLKPLRKVLMSYIELSNIKYKLKENVDRIASKQGEVLGFLELKNKKQPKLNYISTIPKETINEFTDEIKKTLTNWGYKELRSLVFNHESQDILINGQDRKSNGKGFRAFFYAAFSVSLMNLLLSKEHAFTRVLILDSPVTTLKENESKENVDGDMIDPSMQDSLFVSLSQNNYDKQIIILENKELPEQVIECNHIPFTKGKAKGRYGFFPLKSNNSLVQNGVF